MDEGTCTVVGCDRIVLIEARGWCSMHYQRWRKHGDVNWIPKTGRSVCVIDGCDKPINGRGWCAKHYTRWQRYGDPAYRLPGEVLHGKRICPACGIDKPTSEYSGTGRCRPCCADYVRQRREAGMAPRPRVSREWKQCDECLALFPSDKRRSVCCSRECSRARKKRMDAEYAEERGREAANQSNREWYRRNRDKAFNAKAAYRARKKAATVESVDRLVVFERDGWTCQICSTRLDPAARFPEPHTPSVDHVVPLAMGGEHSYANCQATCLQCNVRKGARVPEGVV